MKKGVASLVITSFNALDLLRDCIEHIERYSGCTPYELIVVDNASQDGSLQWLQAYKPATAKCVDYRLIANPENRMIATALAQGLEASTGEFVAFMNCDLVVTGGWLDRLVAHLRNDPLAGAAGPLFASTRYGELKGMPVFFGQEYIGVYDDLDYTYPPDEALQRFARNLAERYPGDYTEAKILSTACCLFWRHVLEAVGGPDSAYRLGGDDWDLSLRIRIAGWKLYIAEDVFIHHLIHGTYKALDTNLVKRVNEKDQAYMAQKWHRLWNEMPSPAPLPGGKPPDIVDLLFNERKVLFSDLRRGRRAQWEGPWYGKAWGTL